MSKIIFILLFSVVAHAQPAEAKVYIWPLQVGMRFERTEGQDLKNRTTQAFGVGMKWEEWYGEIASQNFSATSGEGNTKIKREYQDVALWGGYSLYEIQNLNFMAMAGFGLYKEKIKTTVGTVSDTSTSKEKTLFGVGGEVLFSPQEWWFAASAGARFLWGENFDPNPQPDLYIKLGLSF